MTPRGHPPETLRQYAVLADGERGALVGPRGDIAFMCAPRWHDPAVFSTLIGGEGGYAVTPTERFVWGGHYEPGGLIWRSRWVTDSGIVECREALARPGSPNRLTLLRRIEVIEGDVQCRILLNPRAQFGQLGHDLARVETGEGVLWVGRSGDLHLRWQGAPSDAHAVDGVVSGVLRLPEGGHHDLVLEIDSGTPTRAPVDAGTAWRSTEQAWRADRVDLSNVWGAPDAHHAVAVLHGLTSTDGGMVAAATMSLPERADTGRNYDYRYAWIRDQCFAGHAAVAAGDTDLLVSARDFVVSRLLEHGPELRPAYTVSGGPIPDERALGLPGYPGGTDKVGNWVNHQLQLDAFGEALVLLSECAENDALTPDAHQAARVAARAVGRLWRKPDAGIWELEDRPWTHSRLMCVAGLRRFAHAVPGPESTDWHDLAEGILASTTATSLSPTGHWRRAPTLDSVDASLLLPTLRGGLDPADPRSLATLAAVERDLTQDGYVYRFRHGATPLEDAEGAFLLCGFLLALARHQAGDQLVAARWFERNRSAVGPPGLFAEEFDVRQRQLRGNLPQAFVHAALLETAVRLGSQNPDTPTTPAPTPAPTTTGEENTP